MHSLLWACKYFLLLVGIFGSFLKAKKYNMWNIGLMFHQCFKSSIPNYWLPRYSIMNIGRKFSFLTSQIWRKVLDSKRNVSIAFKDLFFLSTTPFCYHVYETECSIWIYNDVQSCWNSLLTYSLPWSYLSALIFFSRLFSSKYLNIFKFSNTSFF